MPPSRRRFLSTLSATIGAGLAGCTSDGGDGSGARTTGPATTAGTRTATGGDETTAQQTTAGASDIATAVGERVDGERLSMVVRDVSEASKLGQFQEADEGHVYVVVELAVKNTTRNEFLNFSGFLQTRIKDSEDYAYDQTLAFTGKMLDSGELAPGEVTRGNVVYQVPEDASGLTLEFDFAAIDFLDFDHVTVDLEQSAGSVASFDQDLRVPVHDTGEAVAAEGIEVTLNSVETRDAIGSATPEEGDEFVVVDISTTNTTGEEQSISTLLQMSLKDGRGYAYQSDLLGTSQLERNYSQGSPLADGETRRGKLAYEVATGVSPLYWVFEFALLTNGDKTFWQVR